MIIKHKEKYSNCVTCRAPTWSMVSEENEGIEINAVAWCENGHVTVTRNGIEYEVFDFQDFITWKE